MTSKCAVDGTTVDFHCPVDFNPDDNDDYYYSYDNYVEWESISWDFDEFENTTLTFTANLNANSTQLIEEITCSYSGDLYHAILIVTGEP